MKRTEKREHLRSKLIETGISLFNQQGYHGTGIQDIVDAAGVPKGSFYTYFSSKEDFAGEVIQKFSALGAAGIDQRLQEAKSPLTGLIEFFRANRDRLADAGYSGGCLLGNLTNEIDPNNTTIRPQLSAGLSSQAERISWAIEQAQAQGEIREDLPATLLGDLVLNGWEGSLIRAKAQQSPAPLNQFLETFFQDLLPPR